MGRGLQSPGKSLGLGLEVEVGVLALLDNYCEGAALQPVGPFGALTGSGCNAEDVPSSSDSAFRTRCNSKARRVTAERACGSMTDSTKLVHNGCGRLMCFRACYDLSTRLANW